jgi:hypothetical protein
MIDPPAAPRSAARSVWILWIRSTPEIEALNGLQGRS